MDDQTTLTSTILTTVPAAEGGSYEVRIVTFPAGASTGWHTHAARQTGFVTYGAVTRVFARRSEVFLPGDVMVEEPFIPHEGRNEGSEEAGLLYIAHIPEGAEIATPCDPPADVGLSPA